MGTRVRFPFHTIDCLFVYSPHYFKEVKISALALLKMTMHARSGGNIEIMGLMQGKVCSIMITMLHCDIIYIQVDAHTLIVMDSFALPVEGTETRVNAQAQAYEYMTQYTIHGEQTTRKDKVCMLNCDIVTSWYHNVCRLLVGIIRIRAMVVGYRVSMWLRSHSINNSLNPLLLLLYVYCFNLFEFHLFIVLYLFVL
jgi:proteasome lid subunit RPN8/RPN11